MKALLLLPFLSLVLAARLPADPAPEATIPAEMQNIFRGARAPDWGGIASDDGRAEELGGYIRANWRHLMANIKDVPSKGETTVTAIALVAAACEELPPEEYLDFLDAFLTSYSEGLVPDNILMRQLIGIGRKNCFLAANHGHPRVQDFLNKTKGLVPKENESLHETIDGIAEGEGLSNYYATISESEPPPETLPGVTLRRFFGGLIADFDPEEAAGGDTGNATWKTWGLAGTLVVLLLAAWKAIGKGRPSARGTH